MCLLSPLDFLRPVSYEEFLKNASRIFDQYPELSSDEARRACYDHLLSIYLEKVGS